MPLKLYAYMPKKKQLGCQASESDSTSIFVYTIKIQLQKLFPLLWLTKHETYIIACGQVL